MAGVVDILRHGEEYGIVDEEAYRFTEDEFQKERDLDEKGMQKSSNIALPFKTAVNIPGKLIICLMRQQNWSACNIWQLTQSPCLLAFRNHLQTLSRSFRTS